MNLVSIGIKYLVAQRAKLISDLKNKIKKLRQKYRKQINCVQNMTKITQTEKPNLTCSFMIFKALFPYNEVKD